ncbi:MAG: hypothetical protein H0T89_15375 [Deltaproteobacteria bacterium]|nr:hypothetical protein [Deltaproteobacteria bacterium]MDQ3299907.1 hypothetical protein [Myxococcota bacterium]
MIDHDRWRVAVLAVVGLALTSACGDNVRATVVDAAPDAGRNAVERGRYIMNTLGACTFCHTPQNPDGSRDLTRLLAGIDCFIDVVPDIPAGTDPNNAVGCLSSRNLTNHPTGLANATDAQIRAAMTLGIRIDDKKLSPVMPYWVYHNMTDADLDAVIAYMRTVPGVDHTVAANQSPWLEINNGTMVAEPIDPATIPMPAAGPDHESAMRGRYLSSMAGLCIDCHTPSYPPAGNPPQPVLFPRPIDMSKPYAGGRVWFKQELGLVDPSYPAMVHTRNLTPHATGLADWTPAQIKAGIADGKDPDGNAVCAATHGNVISPYAALDAQDLQDITNYIASLPPIENVTTPDCAGPPVP